MYFSIDDGSEICCGLFLSHEECSMLHCSYYQLRWYTLGRSLISKVVDNECFNGHGMIAACGSVPSSILRQPQLTAVEGEAWPPFAKRLVFRAVLMYKSATAFAR